MIPDEIIERVRSAADIVQIIGEYVPLRRTGGSYRGPCPFHQGTKPNFSVTPEKGTTPYTPCVNTALIQSFQTLSWVLGMRTTSPSESHTSSSRQSVVPRITGSSGWG